MLCTAVRPASPDTGTGTHRQGGTSCVREPPGMDILAPFPGPWDFQKFIPKGLPFSSLAELDCRVLGPEQPCLQLS